MIQGKAETPNRPSTISGTNFGFNLPVGAEPTKVIVQYRHQKVAGSDWTNKGKEIMNIPAPTISLLGTGKNTFSGKGVAPTLDMKTSTKTFSVKGKLTRTQVNSNSFGFKVNYPTNTNKYNGYLRVSYVQITVEYKTSSYKVKVAKVFGKYNKESYSVELSITNKNMTSYNPTLTLTVPIGFSFTKSEVGFNGQIINGTVKQVNPRTITWDPLLGKNIGTASAVLYFDVDVTYPSGQSTYSGVFSLVESLNGTSSSHTATITDRPQSQPIETAPQEEYIETSTSTQHLLQHCTVGEEFEYTFQLTEEEYEQIFNSMNNELWLDGANFEIYLGPTLGWHDVDESGFGPEAFDENYRITRTLRAKTVETPSTIDVFYIVYGESSHIPVCSFDFSVRPLESDLTVADFTYLEPNQEELDRLGDGFTYIVQSYLKHTTTEGYIRDWYKNNRILVFNNAIEENITITEETIDGEVVEIITDSTDYSSLTPEDIFTHAEYISPPLDDVNDYENVECEFVYNKDYPLYILLTGDYPEAEDDYGFEIGTLTFTEPCIIEKNVYREREPNGNYPTPIKSLILDDAGSSECEIGMLDTTSEIILYDYPLDDGYGTNDTLSVRGIEVIGDLEQSDELVISAKLISDTGLVGARTVIVNNEDTTVDSDTTFKLGGLGDLWGFQTQDITNLEDWELQLTVHNILLEDVANINFGPITLIIYVEKLETQLINIKVNGEDLSYYGAFIEDVDIPSGLETDTGFLTIDGTDTNDAYRQNIREKEIELKFSIGECDLGTSTDMLRQITKLLVNDKDTYNRPIPNRIEFSHYPDIYFEYIMNDAMSITSELSYYNVTAKLVVPAGTAYSKEITTTNITGNVQGLAAISPVVSFKPQGEVIEIKELVSNQRFSMGYSGDWQSKIVELDCANRIAWLKSNEDDTEAIDISKYVDFNSDWFALKGEYSFSGTNCTIRRVEYAERW